MEGIPIDAMVTGAGFELTEAGFAPPTAACSSSGLAVKFCMMRILPPKSTTAIKCSGELLASTNFLAAARAWIR